MVLDTTGSNFPMRHMAIPQTSDLPNTPVKIQHKFHDGQVRWHDLVANDPRYQLWETATLAVNLVYKVSLQSLTITRKQFAL